MRLVQYRLLLRLRGSSGNGKNFYCSVDGWLWSFLREVDGVDFRANFRSGLSGFGFSDVGTAGVG